MNPPCKGCKDRDVGCHSICAPYLKFKKEREEALRKEKEFTQCYRASREARSNSSPKFFREKSHIK